MKRRSKIALKLALITFLSNGLIFNSPTVFADSVVPENDSDNTVTVSESSYTINDTRYTFDNELEYIYGSSRDATDATGNTVTIDGATVIYGVYGGYGVTSASNNTLNFTSGYSSSLAFTGYGGFSPEGNVSGNNVTITNWSGESELTTFAGGMSYYGNVTNNTVTVDGGNIFSVYGGESYSGTVSNNELIINDGTITGVASGGTTSYTTDDNGTVAAGNITGNTITINGGTIAEVVGGSTGYDSNISDSDISGSSVQITNNTINYYGGTVTGRILGGSGSFSETISGNTLNIYSTNLSASNIGNFDTINFYVPTTATSGSTMLTLTDSSGTDLSNVSINARVYADYSLNEGDTITLLTNSSGITTTGTTFGTLYDGITYVHELSFTPSSTGITATLGKKTLNGQVALATESSVAMTTPVSVNEDLFPSPDNEVLDEAESNEATGTGTGSAESIAVHTDYEIFGYMGGGSLKTKLKNGGYIDSKNGGFDLGISRVFQNSHGVFTLAPLVDYGHGKYDSYLSDGSHGYGNSTYYAAGAVARQMNKSGFYYEGALRIGKSTMDFNSTDLSSDNAYVYYKTDALLLSGHARVGYIIRPNRRDMLHTYLLYSHNHQNGYGTDLHINGKADEHYDFSAVNSGKLRTGFRATRAVKPFSRIYTGLAYQYEYSGNCVAKYEGNDLPATKSAGSSGLIELGWQIKPNQSSPWLFDMNLTGWVGHVEGVTAQVKIKKEF